MDEGEVVIGEEVVGPLGMGKVAALVEGMEGIGVKRAVFFGLVVLEWLAGRGGSFGLGFGLGLVGLGLRLGSGSGSWGIRWVSVFVREDDQVLM